MSTTKPIFWALFAAGGTLAALLAPVLILLTGLAVPLGWLDPEALSHARLSSALESVFVGLALWVTLLLLLWHSAHRLRVTAHDLGWFADSAAVILFYGLAAMGTLASAALLI
jgi:fumarate reductase subunit D